MTRPEFITLGCRLNSFESEAMRSQALKSGLENTVFVNSCAVTNEAVRQTRQAIRKARRAKPDARIVVTGCAAQTGPETFSAMPEVDLVLGNEEKFNPEMFDKTGLQVSDIMQAKSVSPPVIDSFADRARAFVQIQNGCDHRCTFCIVPYGRGPSRSSPAEQVVEQVRRLTGSGFDEIVLTGVDIASWEGGRLGSLVLQILEDVPELARLRLSTLDLWQEDQDLLTALATSDRLMPHLHLSLQSGDDLILKRMKRRHNREDAIAFCQNLRSIRPDIVFGADFIAGFPTETDEMFENTCRIIEECGLTFLHVFPFSPRPGTPAAEMPQLDRKLIKDRARILREAGEKARRQFLSREKGQRRSVLIEKENTGHSEHFAPVKLDKSFETGALVSAEITGVSNSSLQGTAL